MNTESRSSSTVIPGPAGRQLGVCRWGDPHGRTVFWFHGTPGSRFLRHHEGGYVRRGLQVITYDRPGYGLSTPHPGRRSVDPVPDVIAIADSLGLDTFGVAGISGGGPWALSAAAGLPGRVPRCAVVVSGISSDNEHLADTPTRPAAASGIRRVVPSAASLEADWRNELAWIEDGMAGVTISEAQRPMVAEAFAESRRQGSVGYVDDRLAAADGWGFELSDVGIPTRVMVAADDPFVPVGDGRRLVDCLPDARLIIVPGDHLGPRETAELDLVGWAAGVD